jgi:hypothetical protein
MNVACRRLASANLKGMSTVVEIQEAIARLNETKREELRLWLDAYEEDDWDRQITADATSGKLDFMRELAETAKRKGLLRPLPGEIKSNA